MSNGDKGMGEKHYIIWPRLITFTATSAEYLGLRRLELTKVTYLDLPGLLLNTSDPISSTEDGMRAGIGDFMNLLPTCSISAREILPGEV
jgi:hypothetical protein